MGKNKKKPVWKRILIGVGSVVLALVVVAVGYLCYVVFSYSRIKDKQKLSVLGTGEGATAQKNQSYTIVSQNLGFGAYTADFTFFMDGGKQSRAKSKKSVISCISQGAQKAKDQNPDFVFFQEVDTDSTRSHHVDQRVILRDAFPTYSSVFAVNYHSAYLFYPFTSPHGKSNSGILTFSKFGITSSVRRKLPISTSFSKFLDLDRCYSVSRVPVDGGKELVLYNVHLSAYGGSDKIRKGQMTMLFNDMKAEYALGNYCVCGGDFNHDFTGTSTKDLNGGEGVSFGWAQPFPDRLLPSEISRAIDYDDGEILPTCRNCDVAYKEGNFTIIVDGFLVSQNVQVDSVQNLQTGFVYSDHNPVKMQFTLL